MTDIVHPEGIVRIRRYDGAGALIDEQFFKNMVVNSGLEHFANLCSASPTATAMSHMGIGANGTAPAKTNTTLAGEIAGARQALSTPPFQSLNQTVYNATFNPGVATGNISELGIFNAASGGTMLARVTFPTQVKESTTKFDVQWLVAFQ